MLIYSYVLSFQPYLFSTHSYRIKCPSVLTFRVFILQIVYVFDALPDFRLARAIHFIIDS